MRELTGSLDQIPPAYSAKKIGEFVRIKLPGAAKPWNMLPCALK